MKILLIEDTDYVVQIVLKHRQPRKTRALERLADFLNRSAQLYRDDIDTRCYDVYRLKVFKFNRVCDQLTL